MSTNPFFSVIIPCYNCSKSISGTLESVLTQTFTDFEVIMVNDCSSDDTLIVLKQLESKYPTKVRVIDNERNVGPGESRNIGIYESRGEYLCFIDSDDTINPRLFHNLRERLVESGADLIFFNAQRVFSNGKTQPLNLTSQFNENSQKADFIASKIEGLWMLSAKKGLMQKVPMPPTYIAEDAVVIPLLCTLAKKIVVSDYVGYNYFYYPNSLSTSQNKRKMEGFWIAYDFLCKHSDIKYKEAFDFQKIKLMCYGWILNGLIAREPKNCLKEFLDNFETEIPDWLSNRYIPTLGLHKRFFLKLVKLRAFNTLNLYIALRQIMLRLLDH